MTILASSITCLVKAILKMEFICLLSASILSFSSFILQLVSYVRNIIAYFGGFGLIIRIGDVDSHRLIGSIELDFFFFFGLIFS